MVTMTRLQTLPGLFTVLTVVHLVGLASGLAQPALSLLTLSNKSSSTGSVVLSQDI
ncbi:uncharacterized protein PGTG_22466 [Puccinia graminis f. sp. tritici CRL 75-36-700-3]|uniref:Uncharacterized protein n=1 Tax=Puccinia graminis f. sp. tritici (strain CRL 75-36-700-3 / race SCCL) TaxID=418459 RepID=H6QUR6_PUCGT|nr:uncharacterized protein PGTG_22466 [Puccinia graminis f. sp. tritici CRL 75-36-700-3]EHS64824.1 hypothetical protein PGTG_22466 [Puccinia graminis f. sp. tritici CRL 75-36-700-3]